eukprot:530533-Hanusia_phi.AAC.1
MVSWYGETASSRSLLTVLRPLKRFETACALQSPPALRVSSSHLQPDRAAPTRPGGGASI